MVKDKTEESSSKSESRNAPIPSASWYVTYLAASVWTDSPDLSKKEGGRGLREDSRKRRGPGSSSARCARAEHRICLVGQGRHSNCTSVRVDQHFGRGSLAKRPGLLPRTG